MANLEQIVSRKAENDTKWKEAQQAERENTTAMQDAGITEITSNPEAYARYLEMQGDNPSYSAGNIALVMFGNPEATVFGTRDRWKTLSRSVMDSEKSNGVSPTTPSWRSCRPETMTASTFKGRPRTGRKCWLPLQLKPQARMMAWMWPRWMLTG